MFLPTILVVEDEPTVLRVVRVTLEQDFEVLTAESAPGAWAISQAHPGNIDLIVADHTLKQDLGIEIVDKIRAVRPNIQVLYLSGHRRDHLGNLKLPPDAEFLEKPFLPKQLRTAVARLLSVGDRSARIAALYASGPNQESGSDPQLSSVSACMELLCDELLSSPSMFSRMVAVSNYWNPALSRYNHPLAKDYGIDEVNRALKRLHRDIFAGWLRFSPRQQKTDVAIYLSGIANSSREVSALREIGMRLPPPGAIEPERRLFLADLSIVQALLAFES